ncbi:MAG TPA: septum site-determining protein Ssd [Mycobacteriales bacterium]|nr:septum site-determining protein Ssd [Mycobacteriales bacterium]
MAEPRPLLATNDADLLDDLLRLAAAADVEVDVAVDPVAVRARWSAAPLVLLGADLAGASLISESPARVGVLLVCRGSPAADAAVRAAGLAVDGVLALPDAEGELVERLATSVATADVAARVIGVLGGCGGAGASVLAAALALTAVRRNEPALLLDLDVLGSGLDLLLGAVDESGLRWPELAGVSGRLPSPALRAALPAVQGISVLSHRRRGRPALGSEAICAVVEAGRRGGGVIVLDLPRYPPAADVAVGLADELIMLVPADVRAAASAVQVAERLAGQARSVGLVVRRPPASVVSAETVAEVVELPLLGEIRSEPGLSVSLCRGRPLELRRRGPLALLCERLLDQLLGVGREAA